MASPKAMNLNLTQAQYLSTAKPVLNQIHHAYYELLLSFYKNADHLKNISNFNLKIRIELIHMKKVCLNQEFKSCLPSIDIIKNLLKKIEREYLILMGKKVCEEQSISDCFTLSETIPLIYTSIAQSQNIINFFFIQKNLSNQKYLVSFSQLEKEIYQIMAYHSVILSSIFPPLIKNELIVSYISFFKPIEEVLIPQNSAGIFNSQMEKLNFSVNELNQFAEKSQKKLSGDIKSRIEQIHTVWNSMLRMYY